jgi:hypothetical protein
VPQLARPAPGGVQPRQQVGAGGDVADLTQPGFQPTLLRYLGPAAGTVRQVRQRAVACVMVELAVDERRGEVTEVAAPPDHP